MNKKLELAKDIVAYASVLIKFGGDNVVHNQSLFIESLNLVGFQTISGKEFTKMGFRKFFERMTMEEKLEIIEEFKLGHRDTDIFTAMFEGAK